MTITTVGKRMFWACEHLGGPATAFESSIPVGRSEVTNYLILQCDSMLGIPYRCEGCCIMLYNGVYWKFGVVIEFNEQCLCYRRISGNSLQLDNTSLFKIDVSDLSENYIFKFVNIFHPDRTLLESNFLHYCVVNKYNNVEGMLLPSLWKKGVSVSVRVSRKELRQLKRKRKRSKYGTYKDANIVKKNRRSKLQDVVLGRMEECWHTIYVRKNNKSVCHEICKQNKLKGSFYIIVPSPLYNAKKEEWISLRSGFKYTYREHFIIDVVYLKHLKKIRNVVELHFNLSHLSVGSVNLIQPFNCHNTRFCIVSNRQFSILRKNQQMEMMSTGSNSYLY